VSGVLLTVTAVTDLGRLLYGLLHGWPDALEALRQSRLQAGVVALGTALLVPFAMWTARGRLVLSRVRVPLEKLAPGVAGLRIVQISDLHIGARLGEDFLRRVVDRVNALHPDVVAITGDLVDGPAHIVERALKPLADLDAPHGVYFVTGNHEYYWGGRESVRMVQELGLIVLHNEHRSSSVKGGTSSSAGCPTSTAPVPRRPRDSPGPGLRRSAGGSPARPPRPPASGRHPGCAARGGSPALGPHPRRTDLPLPLFVRLQQPVVRGLRKLLGVWVYAHRGTGFWGPADAAILHARNRRESP
jgi:hypothetical protein